ncbi:MAG: alpha-glucan family phosphorylase [Acidobacteriota bacterium]
MREAQHFQDLPERIRGLGRLAYNLWWSWNPDARALFWALDLYAWRASGHNPILMMANLDRGILDRASSDPAFLKRYDAVMARFEAETGQGPNWFESRLGQPGERTVAYLSAEFGLHATLPHYAGGLGILAGDHLKECSDLGVPVVGVGLSYSRGYITQRMREDGSSEDVRETLDRTYHPVSRVLDDEGRHLLVKVPIFEPAVHVGVWRVNVGRVLLYLLDTDLECNQPWDRAIAHHLYATGPESRLRQEIVLGMGGMKVLEVMGIRPGALHINEGHPALAMLTRVRWSMEDGLSLDEALSRVQESSIFTTHTPVPAGTDVFPRSLMQKYLGRWSRKAGIDLDRILEMGRHPDDPEGGFNMTVFSLRMTEHRNAVSRRHGEVARSMWSSLWPDRSHEDVPLQHVTNGVHLPTWIDPLRLQPLLDQYLGEDWRSRQDRSETWEAIDRIPDEVLWQAHQDLKVRMINQVNKRAVMRWRQRRLSARSIIASGALLSANVLTIGFARRFTGYKRPDLILHDMERFKRLVTDPWHPIQVVFSGKAHPADQDGKNMIKRIFRIAQDPDFAGRVVFLEDYDQALAGYLVRGVDVWLNNPVPPLEASGTSGMKASVNGTLNLSILDGWWPEAYTGQNGWGFGGEEVQGDRTPADAGELYKLLEEEVIPLYYQSSDGMFPREFVRKMKHAVKTVAPVFCSRRMVKEYVERFYAPALGLSTIRDEG